MSCNHNCNQGRNCTCAITTFYAETEGVMPMQTGCSMKTTHGPWIARNNGHFWEVGTSLAEFAHSVAHVPQSAFMPGDAEANARLLASAPDLLAERDKLKALNAELAAALGALDEAYCSDHSDRESRIAGRKALIASRAALAKQKGETA